MKLLLKLSICIGLIQGCGSAKKESAPKNAPIEEVHPDALSDEQIVELEKEASRLEKELTQLASEPRSSDASSKTCEALEVPSQDLEGNGKGKECSEKCQLIQEINAALKAGDCAKAKELLKSLTKDDNEKKLKKCKEKIKKAKDCRKKKKDGDQGGTDQDKDDDDKDDQGKGTEPTPGKTDPNDPIQNPGKGKS